MYLGDYAEDYATLTFLWNSNAVAGESITRGTNGTISVYKDGGVTQSTAGVTDTEDFDGLTGVHKVLIDLSADAFYAAGSEYAVVLSAATIDGKSVNAVLAHFSIERAGGALALAKGANGFAAIKTQTAAIELDTAEIGTAGAGLTNINLPNQTMDIVGNITGNLSGSVGSVTGAVGSVAAGGITTASFAAGAINNTVMSIDGSELTAVPWNAAWDAEVQSEVEDALVVHRLDELLNADSDIDGAAPPTVGSVFHELLSKTAGSFTYDQATDSLEAIRDRGDAAWTTAVGFSTHSASDVWAVATRVLTAGTNIDGSTFTTIPWNAAWDAEVQSEVQDALEANNLDHLVKIAVDTNFATTVHADSVVGQLADNGTGFDRATDSLEAIRDRGDAAWVTATGFSTLSQADVRSAVGLGAANLDTQLSGIQSDADNIQTRLPAALVGGRIDASVGAMAADTVTASAIAADASAEIADAVWDEARSGHVTVGSFGEYVPANATHVEGVSLGSKVGDNLNLFFQNAGADTTKVVDDVGGGGGGATDWTTTERAQIRYRLGIDGSESAPVTNTDLNLGTVAANVTQISGDAAAADSLESVLDGTGGVTLVANITGNLSGSIGSVAAGGISAASLAADTITAAKIAADVATEIAAGVWGTSVPGAFGAGTAGLILGTNLDAAVSSRSTYAGGDTAGTTTLLSRLTAGRASALDNLDAAVSSRSTYAGTDTSGTTTLLSRLTSGRATALDNLDAAVSSRLASSTYSAAPTAASIADAVWDETLADHVSAGSTGQALSASGSAGDPWITPLPGGYVAGQAGHTVGTYLDARVSQAGGGSSAAEVAAAVVNKAVLSIATPSSRLVDSDGTQLSEVTLGQTLAALLVILGGDRAGIGTRTVTGSLSGAAGLSVSALRSSQSTIESTVTVPAVE